eukprot:Skav226388  [mRNA]  locus=scaffold1631:52006:57687:+ [translate_table: standard]
MATDGKDGLSDESKGVTYGEVIRDYQPATGAKWRSGCPDYAAVNKLYFENRVMNHAEGSLEALIQKLMKNWDVECRHIADIHQWQTVDIGKFKAALNGGCPFNAQLLSDMSHADVLTGETTMLRIGETAEYSAKASNADIGMKNFAAAFPEGFALEVLEVFSGPPNVTFKWRHFGKMTGSFVDKHGKDHKGNGEMLNVIGLCIAKVSEDLKIESVDVYYNPNDLARALAT